ncbi:MAG: hypothetical protein MUC49_04500 [Raineya sp.]|jgi:hypothetical protein|nr:hypothetical protein [Raineya sp.]
MKPQVSLNKQEKKLLEKGKAESLWVIILLVGAGILFKYLLYHTPNAQRINDGWLALIPLMIGIGLLIGVIYGIKNYLKYQLDIRVGQKISVSGIIQEKFSRRSKNNTHYFIVVNGVKFKLPDEIEQINYDLKINFVQKGDSVTIWFSPKTKTVFSILNQVFINSE